MRARTHAQLYRAVRAALPLIHLQRDLAHVFCNRRIACGIRLNFSESQTAAHQRAGYRITQIELCGHLRVAAWIVFTADDALDIRRDGRFDRQHIIGL